jgi:hypothetical protein
MKFEWVIMKAFSANKDEPVTKSKKALRDIP